MTAAPMCDAFAWCDGEHVNQGDHRGYLVGGPDPSPVPISATVWVDQRPDVTNDRTHVDFVTPEEWWADTPDELDAEIDMAIAALEAIRRIGKALYEEVGR